MPYVEKGGWGKPSLRTDEVEVPELNGKVRIRELPAGYSAEVASNIKLITEGREQVARVDTRTMERLQFAYGVIDAKGEQMFSEAEVGKLQNDHGRAFKTVVNAIDALSGIDKEALEKTEERFQAGGTRSANGSDVDTGTPARSG